MKIYLSTNYSKVIIAVQSLGGLSSRVAECKKIALQSALSFVGSKIGSATPLSIIFPLVLSLKASSEKKKALGIDRSFDRSLTRVIGFLLFHLFCCYSAYSSCIDLYTNRALNFILLKVSGLCYQFLGVKAAGSEISASDFFVKMSSSLVVESFAGAVAEENGIGSEGLIAATFLASVVGYYIPGAVEALMRSSSFDR